MPRGHRSVAALCLLALACVLSWTMTAHGEPVTQLKPVNYVSDFAHALDENTEAQLNALCREVDERAHAQIAVVTINTLDGRDVEGYAVDLFKQWGVGSKSTNRGVLILYAMQDHKSRIEVGYGLEAILPDGKVGGFMREAVPLMRQGNSNGALTLVTRRVADVIAADAHVQLANVPTAAPPPERSESNNNFSGVLVFLFVILLLFTPLRRVLFWMLIGNMLGGGRRGGGGFGGFGGGFGGGGGGGGFGGFGGGMSGGGGASGGW